MSRYQVAFLFDKSNNWLERKFHLSEFSDLSHRYCFYFSNNPQEVSGFDCVFALGYTKLLSPEFLLKNDLTLVVHESDLPRGKGFSPVQWQILEGRNRIPICLFEAVESVDSGDIFLKDYFELDGYELYDEIRNKQANATIKIIHDFLEKYPAVTRTKQAGKETLYPKRTPKDNELDISKSIIEQFALLRIGNNEGWPSFFVVGGYKYVLKIFKV